MVRTAQLEDPPPADTDAAPSEAWLPNILLAAAVVLLIVVVLGKSRRTAIAKSREIVPTPEERLAELRERAAGDAGIERRVAVAADQIRELTAVLDTRIETLDILIQQADERIANLQPRPSTPERPVRDSDTGGSGVAGDASKRAIYDLADQGMAPAEIAAQLGQHTGKVELILALRRV